MIHLTKKAPWLFVFLVSSLLAQPGQVELSTDTKTTREGKFKLTWTAGSLSKDVHFRLTEHEPGSQREPIVFLEGNHKGITISGKSNGKFRYVLEAYSPENPGEILASDSVEVTVRHHSLTNAFIAFTTGAVLFLITILMILTGHRKSDPEDSSS